MTHPKHQWQDWQLTAYLLGEFKPELAEQIRSAADSDPQLAAELQSLRETIDSVSAFFERESSAARETHVSCPAFEEIGLIRAVSGQEPHELPSDLVPRLSQSFPHSHVSGQVQNESSSDRLKSEQKTALRSRLRWLGVAASAASLFLAVAFSLQATISSWMTLGDSKNRLLSFNVGRTLDSSRSMESLATEPASGKTAEGMDKKDLDASAIGSVDELGEKSGLFGDVRIEFVEDRGSVIARGREADVEQALEVAENLKQSGVELSRLKTEKRQLDENLSLADLERNKAKSASRRLNRKSDFGLESELDSRNSRASDGGAMLSGTPGAAPSANGLGLGGGMGMGSGMSGMTNAVGGMSTRGNSGNPGVKGTYGMAMGSGAEGGMGVVPAPGASATGGMMGGGGYGSGMAGRGDMPSDAVAVGGMPGMSGPGYPRGKSLAESEVLARGRDAMPEKHRFYYEGYSADRYAAIAENAFVPVSVEPLSTFSIDVDTASYAKTRQFLKQLSQLPPVNAVRIEELINYFEYEYAGPKGDVPFGADLAVADCPWTKEHKLVRIALQAKKVEVAERPNANIVFLLDVSGSMAEPNKLPLVKEAMRMLVQQLGENDRIAIAVYAGAAGCVLESITGDHQETILGALDRLNAGGSTNGGQGIQLAYNLARDHFIPGGINRVILCTDGDFNVGVTSTEALVDMVATNAKSKIFLTVLGFGMGNTNDAMMEQISNKGNGVYGFVDSRQEAKRQMVLQLAGNLMTVAKDVKIQVEFNPAKVKSYRLIGYENRALATEDFSNDKKDAGEIGAGHRVTALYEIAPATAKSNPALRYQQAAEVAREQESDKASGELLAVNLRYKQPEGDESRLLTFPLQDRQLAFEKADRDFRWAASVAQFGMLLRHSPHAGSSTWKSLIESAEAAAGLQPDATRAECLEMIEIAARLSGQR